MRVEHINPFIESAYEVFQTMLSTALERGKPHLVRPGDNGHGRDISALIGLSGTARGTVALSFPTATALAIASALMGNEVKIVDDSVCDALGEMVNMVAGGAKARFDGHAIAVSLPTIVRGTDHSVRHPSDAVTLGVPFESALGSFSMDVSFKSQ